MMFGPSGKNRQVGEQHMKIYFTQRVIGTGMPRIEPKQQKKVPATVAP